MSSPSLQSGMVEEPLPQPDVFQMDTDGGGEEEEEEEEESNRRTSSSSNDSFHSTLAQFDSDPMFLSSHNQLYHSALELVTSGGVKCRKIRYKVMTTTSITATAPALLLLLFWCLFISTEQNCFIV